MWNDPLPGQIINLNKGFIGFFCFYKTAAILFFLNVATITVVTAQNTISISVKLDLKYVFSEASLVIKTPLYSSIFQRKEIIGTRHFQHMQSMCTLWVHMCILSEGQKNFLWQYLQKIPRRDREQDSGVPLRKQRLWGDAQLYYTTPVSWCLRF